MAPYAVSKAAGSFAGCNSSEMVSPIRLTWLRRATISVGSPAGAVFFDIVDKRKGCAGGGAVSVLFVRALIRKSIPNQCEYVMVPGLSPAN